ncbi:MULTISPECIES: glycoside hydrolase family 15 protein [unclassified Frondihabitans]|uniref:glycoside hydrolase family 15 protein n=1 Tax=unclassified Frondihabitans TaxID=2626248 RepID=UPI000F4EE733|nr:MULTISPECIES: glycoside hydrolase family 15 protein [unclassified Frondihabitans]RPE75318.1 GH15 family glucan-1,4-alpha-glucosidase [Frondihabitans sp. PhB153]RPF04560.1 GH15 family glucan-1,4-alpha-glucosidase [Frondihabitans sp. PhB161]
MPLAIEDYALIGDCHTAALVGRNGSIDWLCLPRFDSASMFAALLGDDDNGRWLVAPSDEAATATRSYVDSTFVLTTRWVTTTGEVEVTDLMPYGDRRADVVRRIRGIRGTVTMHEDLRIRFAYTTAIPWIRQIPDSADIAAGRGEPGTTALIAIAGPDAVVVRGPKLTASDHTHEATFDVSEGETVDLSLTWYPSHREPPAPIDVGARILDTVSWWQEWASHSDAPAVYSSEVHRSLLLLRALTHEDTNGIVAAATTSLPEQFGGQRNWDYRYVWLRDASMTLQALILHGFADEATGWRDWLLRAIAGDPADVQIMYGLAGERYLAETTIDELPGYQGAAPVRIGNGAFTQYQGDVFGEVMVALHDARELGVEEGADSWSLQRALMSYVEDNWSRPDNGIWEIRGEAQHFTHSRVMIWAALDRAIRGVQQFHLEGPVDRWLELREKVRDEIEEHGYDAERNCYVQHYGSKEVDASLLQLAQVGYVDAHDPRMLGTVKAIEEDLLHDGLLLRYRTESGVDGLAGTENPFLACSFWLAEQYGRSGRIDDATRLMDRLVGFANDVGMLSEEIEVATGRHVGNTPQALSHLALVRAADAIDAAIEHSRGGDARRLASQA